MSHHFNSRSRSLASSVLDIMRLKVCVCNALVLLPILGNLSKLQATGFLISEKHGFSTGTLSQISISIKSFIATGKYVKDHSLHSFSIIIF